MGKRTIIHKLMIGLMAVMISGGLITDQLPVYGGTQYTGSDTAYYMSNRSAPLAEGNYGNTAATNEITFHFDFVTNGENKISMEERRIKPKFARRLYFGKPQIACCNYCRSWAEDQSLYSAMIFIEDDMGREYIRKSGLELTQEDLKRSGVDFENLLNPIRVGLELTQRPGKRCPYCEKHIGDYITIDGLWWEITCIEFSSHPRDVSASYGGSANFEVGLSKYRDIYGTAVDKYKWEMTVNDADWISINDGISGSGAVFSGSDTPRLSVSNIDPSLYGSRFRCTLRGSHSSKAYSGPANLILPEYIPDPTPTPVEPTPTSVVAEPSVTPDNPTPVITPTEPEPAVPTGNPQPTLPPDVTAVPAIIPGNGSEGEYTPSSSSSVYVPPKSSSAKDTASTSSSSHVKDQGQDSYKGNITVSEPLSADPGGSGLIITASNNAAPLSSNAGKKGKVTTSNSTGKSMEKSSSSERINPSSSATSRRNPGANYIMKNGVLYLVDDEAPSIGTTGEKESSPAEIEEEETENEYMAEDLAIDGNIQSAELDNGFWSTVWGRILIIAIAVLLLLLALFILFFGVVVCGEVEEHDEVFELCSIRLMKWYEGSWHVNLGCAFDENAVLKLHIGVLFAVIFAGWDITGKTKGLYEGEVTSPAEGGMLMHRKNIRRSV